jgi:hypothetical protein
MMEYDLTKTAFTNGVTVEIWGTGALKELSTGSMRKGPRMGRSYKVVTGIFQAARDGILMGHTRVQEAAFCQSIHLISIAC